MPNWLARLEYGLFQVSRSMGPPWGPALRWLRYPVALVRDWLRGDINVWAMSLAYTTLLSLVPLMVFSFAIVKGLGARADLKFILEEFFRPLGGAAAQLTDAVMQFVVNMRGELLGSIGLAFLLYTVLTTVQKVEASFNFVWRVAQPRSFGRRFTEYLSVMILGPILLAVAIGLLGTAENSPIAQRLHEVAPLTGVLAVLRQAAPYTIVTVVFTFMYAFIPNTQVRLRPALIGGVAAGIIWALVGKVFTTVIVYSSQLVAVYTGFAIVVTTLIWVYLSWLILLIGAQLAFYVQFPQYLRHGQETIELAGRAREEMGLSIMCLLGRGYGAGGTPWSAAQLAANLDVPSIALAPVLARLERRGLIVATRKELFVPARDPAGILLADIMDAVRTLEIGRLAIEVHCVPGVAAIMGEVETTLRQRLGPRSLEDLIGATA